MKFTHENGVMTIFMLILIGSTSQYENKISNKKTGFIKSYESNNKNLNKANIVDYETSWVDSFYKERNSKSSPLNSQLLKDYKDYEDFYFPNIKLLDSLKVSCGSQNSAINSFNFQIKGTKNDKKKQIGYKYSCVTSPEITNNCSYNQTDFYRVGPIIKASLNTLGKLVLECNDDEVLRDFDLVTSGSFNKTEYLANPRENWPKLSYRYSCCKANISLIVRAKNARTLNKDNSIENLRNQNVQARDTNALNRIALTTPGNYIAYEYKAAILNGEDSPTFSYKFDPATKGIPYKETIPSFIGNNKYL